MQKNWLKFDFSFYLVTLLAIILGYLDQYMMLAITILIHESGHLVMAYFYRWKLEELKFFGLGGVLTFHEELNKSNKEDIIISSGGLLFNFIFLLILLLFKELPMSLVYVKKYQYLIFAQIFIISFNLLPLPPLDGGRIFSAVLCFFFPYKKVLKITALFYGFILIIFTIILITFFYNFRQYFLILSFLIYTTLKYNWQGDYLFQRFLVQKKLDRNTSLPVKTVKINKGTWEDNIYRGYINLFQIKTHINDEIKFLNLKYGKKTGY